MQISLFHLETVTTWLFTYFSFNILRSHLKHKICSCGSSTRSLLVLSNLHSIELAYEMVSITFHPCTHTPSRTVPKSCKKKNTFSVSYHLETDLYNHSSRGNNLSHFVKWLSPLLEREAIIRSASSISHI